MLGGRLRQLPGCRAPSLAGRQTSNLVNAARPQRGGLTILAVGDFFKNVRSGGSGKQGGGKGDEDAARKALEGAFGGKNQNKFKNFFGQQPAAPAGGGGDDKGFGGFGGGGGGGGGFGSGAPEGGGSDPERPIMSEIWEAFRYSWSVFWNLALFLGFANLLHRSLDWCCSVELLFLVGAPQQAFERLAGRFFAVVEWVEKNMLGWDIPGEEDMIPQYENLKLFYPREHAYVFDQYKYNLTDKEKETLMNAYALRHNEREGGRPGDVDKADIAAIRAKYDPLEADRKAYLKAKAAHRLEDYWESRKDQYEKMTGQRFVRPPGVSAPAASS